MVQTVQNMRFLRQFLDKVLTCPLFLMAGAWCCHLLGDWRGGISPETPTPPHPIPPHPTPEILSKARVLSHEHRGSDCRVLLVEILSRFKVRPTPGSEFMFTLKKKQQSPPKTFVDVDHEHCFVWTVRHRPLHHDGWCVNNLSQQLHLWSLRNSAQVSTVRTCLRNVQSRTPWTAGTSAARGS